MPFYMRQSHYRNGTATEIRVRLLLTKNI